MKGPDPGYFGTAILVTQAALTVLEEEDKMPEKYESSTFLILVLAKRDISSFQHIFFLISYLFLCREYKLIVMMSMALFFLSVSANNSNVSLVCTQYL